MKQLVALLVTIAVVLVAYYCWRCPPGRCEGDHRKLVAWLECEECDRGQMDSVVQLGTRVSATLSSYLLNGPDSARSAKVRLSLRQSAAGLSKYRLTNPDSSLTTLVDSQYVELYASNFDATYRTRSAMALGRIKGKIARAALDSARNLPLRPDVLVEIRFARDSLIGP